MTYDVKSLLKQVPTMAYVYALGAVALFGTYQAWAYHQRTLGRVEAAAAIAIHDRDSLAVLLKAKTPVFARDTVRVVRSVTTIDTLIQHRVDTALVHQTDTVKITVREAVAVQDTLRACRQLVRDCADIQRDLRAFIHADSAIIKSLRAQMPGPTAPLRYGLLGGVIGAAVVYVLKP